MWFIKNYVTLTENQNRVLISPKCQKLSTSSPGLFPFFEGKALGTRLKNYGPLLLFKTIFGHRNFLLSSILRMVRNDIDLNLKNSFKAMPAIITKKLLWLVGSLMNFFLCPIYNYTARVFYFRIKVQINGFRTELK